MIKRLAKFQHKHQISSPTMVSTSTNSAEYFSLPVHSSILALIPRKYQSFVD